MCSRPSLSPRKAMVFPASVAAVTAVSWVVEVKVGMALSGTVLAMGLGVCSPPQGYSDRESWMEREREFSFSLSRFNKLYSKQLSDMQLNGQFRYETTFTR